MKSKMSKPVKPAKLAATPVMVEPAIATPISAAMQQGRAQVESILEMVAALNAAEHGSPAWEDAEQAIRDDPLSIQVRTDWHDVVAAPDETPATEFNILLCTGGPAVRLIGELTTYGEPDSVRVEVQDWGTPWTELRGLTEEEEAALLSYCRVFYSGEG